jgi:hypothetical protein
VGGEVAEQVRPAELAAGRVEVVVACPAVGADDPVVAFAEHDLGLGAVPAGGDPEHRSAPGERTPEQAALAAGLPTGLVDVDDGRALDLLLQAGVRAASASPVRRTIASTVPVESSTPNSSRASSVVSRRETRLRTASVTTAACSLGPNAQRDAAGASAVVTVSHSGQQTWCSRCSVTRTAIGGSSAT